MSEIRLSTSLRVVLQLMKLARDCEMLRFFDWLAGIGAKQLPDSLLKRLLLYALHADEDLDVEEIYGKLSSNPDLQHKTMSVAEKLRAEGRKEGLEKGLGKGLEEGLEKGLEKGLEEGLRKGRKEGLIGQILLLELFLGLAVTRRESLEELDAGQLEARCQELHRDYEARFKGH